MIRPCSDTQPSHETRKRAPKKVRLPLRARDSIIAYSSGRKKTASSDRD